MTSDLTSMRPRGRCAASAVAVVLLCLGANACGGTNDAPTTGQSSTATGHNSTTASASDTATTRTAPGPTTRGRPEGDVHDADDAYQGKSVHEKNDDISVVDFGHEASPPQKAIIGAAVRRYYTAAAAGDSASACRLLAAPIVAAVPKGYLKGFSGSKTGTSACAYGLSKLFAGQHARLMRDASGLSLIGVRVEGDKGYALLKFKGNPEPRVFAVEREGGTWKLEEFIDGEYP